jgi:diguanylate cyclase (GGDEF)-like protein/PAS domain S-box-containing protein
MQQAVTAAGADHEAVMRIVLDAAVSMIPAATAAVIEMREGDELVYAAASDPRWTKSGVRISIFSSLSGQCLIEGTPLRCDDTEIDERVDRFTCRRIGIRSLIVVPLPHRGETVGVLKICAPEPNAFSDSDFVTAQLLAGPLTVGLASLKEADADAARRLAERRFAATFEQAAVGIAHVAPDGRFLLVNDRFCEITGHSRQYISTRSFQDITHPDDLDADLELVGALLARKVPRYSLEKRYLDQAGETVWINLTVSLVRDDGDKPQFFLAVIEDISARKRAEQAALHDPLTGLLNRRGITEKLERELNRSAFGNRPLTIAYLDLDGFKSVNDRLGHPEGDRCLNIVARALERASRPGDVIGRLGGDEFLILLPDLTDDGAGSVATRLREEVLASAADHRWHITASIGLLCLESGTKPDTESVITDCDALMYRAKQKGKNRHVLSVRR